LTGNIYCKELYGTFICNPVRESMVGFVIFHGKSSGGFVILVEAYPGLLNVVPVGLASITGFPV
jgi:hypothetical protein